MRKISLPSWCTLVRKNVSAYEKEVLLQEKCATSAIVARLLRERLGCLLHEEMVVVCLDGQNYITHLGKIAQGGRHGCAITVSEVFRLPCAVGASAIILVHNHPSGDPTPSTEDREMTQTIASCGDILRIPLVDHLILAGTAYSSLLDLGLM